MGRRCRRCGGRSRPGAGPRLTPVPQFDLFGAPDPDAVQAASPRESHVRAAAHIPPKIRIGTSSWSFPGWNGLVYDGIYSDRQLARGGLRAYAEHPLLRTVGIDRSYYAPLTADDYAEYAAAVPPDFRFLVKAERLLTLPDIEDSRGNSAINARFLDPYYARDVIVEPILAGLGNRAGPILFQFSPMHPQRVRGAATFAERLKEFLSELPVGPLYAVELRTPALFTNDYFHALESANAVHTYTVHGSMMPLAEQLALLPVSSQRSLVIRWMLHGKFGYNDARAAYAPFNRMVDPDEAVRDAIVAAAIEADNERKEAYVVINNKAEGSSPLSAFALGEMVAESHADDVA